jgi:hypothetical protein
MSPLGRLESAIAALSTELEPVGELPAIARDDAATRAGVEKLVEEAAATRAAVEGMGEDLRAVREGLDRLAELLERRAGSA